MRVLAVGGLGHPIAQHFPGSVGIQPINVRMLISEINRTPCFLVGFSWGAQRVLEEGWRENVRGIFAHSPGKVSRMREFNCFVKLFRTRGDILCYNSTERVFDAIRIRSPHTLDLTTYPSRVPGNNVRNHIFVNAVDDITLLLEKMK